MSVTAIAVGPGRASRGWIALLALVLGFLWLILVQQLHVEWTVNAQYTYGWAVPVLCAFLFHRRWSDRPARQRPRAGPMFWLGSIGLALVLLPTRWVQEANPEWRLVGWLLAVEAVGLTLLAVYAGGGRAWLQHFAFPIGYFLVAVPWPTVIEGPVVQGLMRTVVACTVELLGVLGVPALAHGNLVQVSTGVVGIEEACSGIRSFQASLMLSLFFGEFSRLTGLRRAGLVLAGFLLAFFFNIGRTLLLVWLAARDGLPALARWHDSAGVTILVACFLGLWLLSVRLRSGGGAPPAAPESERQPASSTALPRFRAGLVAFAIWLVCVEVGVELWYRARERNLPDPVAWGITWPQDNRTFREIAVTDATRQYLRFDEAMDGGWREPDGTVWQMIYLRWNAGRVAPHLAKNHTPEICLTASGRKLISASPSRLIPVHGLPMPFRSYVVEQRGAPVHVFYCLWEDRVPGATFGPDPLGFRSRLRAALEGRRNLGQRSLEVVVWGLVDPAVAESALRRQLEKLLLLSEPSAGQTARPAAVARGGHPA